MPQHLARTDTNKRVEVVAAAGRASLNDIDLDLQMFDAISHTNRRVKRTLIHVRIAPEKSVSEADLLQLIKLNELIHGIPSDRPRIVVRHSKGERADHFHVLWPSVCADGKCVRSHDNYLRDEIISREAELSLGERIIPGPRMPMVIAHFEQSGRDQQADALKRAPRRDRRSRMGDKAFNMAAKSDADIASFQTRVLDAWLEHGAAGDFVQALRHQGMGLALGDKPTSRGPTILVVEDATGFHASLRRTINAAAKARGLSINLTADQLPDFINLQPLAEARENGFREALERALEAGRSEAKLLAAEIEEDGDSAMAKPAEISLPPKPPLTFRQTLKARRDEIKKHYEIRDDVRRARVDRAFAAAGVCADKRTRRIVFAAAAAGVLLSGGGLGLALIAGGVARVLLPTRELARARAKAASIERRRDRDARSEELHQAYALVREQFRGQKRRTASIRVFSPADIDDPSATGRAPNLRTPLTNNRYRVHPLGVPPAGPPEVAAQTKASPALSKASSVSPDNGRPQGPGKPTGSVQRSASLRQFQAPAVPPSGKWENPRSRDRPRGAAIVKTSPGKSRNEGIDR
ncbi:hypothetical protein [Phreatobacter sp.]|uniref:hypothetical protein n=1 Tax=Phreatobacter sp. TaxID=1966341 RepID=UPI0025E7A026|nr:hypothetical protein [Phreatobacter sp.]